MINCYYLLCYLSLTTSIFNVQLSLAFSQSLSILLNRPSSQSQLSSGADWSLIHRRANTEITGIHTYIHIFGVAS